MPALSPTKNGGIAARKVTLWEKRREEGRYEMNGRKCHRTGLGFESILVQT